MNFQARSTLVMVIVFLLVYGWYFTRVLTAAAAGPVEAIEYRSLLLAMVGVLVALSIAAHIVLAVAAPGEGDQSDERDKLIDLRGEQKGSLVLGVFALGAMALAMFEQPSFWVAHVLLAGLVLAEVVKGAFKLVDYRRGL